MEDKCFRLGIITAPNQPVRARRLYPRAPRGYAALRRAAPPKQDARPGWARPCFAYWRPLGARLAPRIS